MRWIGGLTCGGLSDRIGRKIPLLITLAWFTAGAAATGLSWNFVSLAVFRLWLGFGMAPGFSPGSAQRNELSQGDRVMPEHTDASTTEAMATLSEYLEIALDGDGSLFMVREQFGTFALYVGKAGVATGTLVACGSISGALGEAILAATQSGANVLNGHGVTYRFLRSFTKLGSRGAIVLSTF
ncbi:hypothetical protein [Paraburkholderia sp. Ac-20336]|uniref:hypothetical protein n=1 Tax=Paraburkholderia sp. Ac-20336 TaxID=2703886 RepID=UPI003216F68F